MTYLPDVNVLLALVWPNHQFHAAARIWFDTHAKAGWSTCAVTQLGFVRLSSNPAFTPHAKTPLEATMVLAGMTAHAAHSFLETMPPCHGPAFEALATRLQGHMQITDAYLLFSAHHHQRKLATFDRHIQSYSPFIDAVAVIAMS